ncbi:MAG TPA: hypothetical protein VD999_06085 [Vitreimonas sp.]|nr:hypothetical protein [Vitreimonas sp.]
MKTFTLARGLVVPNKKALVKNGLAIANKDAPSFGWMSENWPGGLSFGRLDENRLGLKSFENMAEERVTDGKLPAVGIIHLSVDTFAEWQNQVFLVRRELGWDKLGGEEIIFRHPRDFSDMNNGFEFTVLPGMLKPKKLNLWQTEIGLKTSPDGQYIYRSFEEVRTSIEGTNPFKEFLRRLR